MLAEDYPDVRVAARTAGFVVLTLSAGLFERLPYRARFTLEVPLAPGERLSPSAVRVLHRDPWRPGVESGTTYLRGDLPLVPDVRAWATWAGDPARGVLRGARIVSHHAYPDGAICACMPEQWVRGVHPLRDYADFLVCWVAKALHEREFGVYPGRQHYPEWARVARDRPDEYCGCGSDVRYRDCHRPQDQELTRRQHWEARWQTRLAYFAELARYGRSPHLPAVV